MSIALTIATTDYAAASFQARSFFRAARLLLSHAASG
jgi:hypothetical protein